MRRSSMTDLARVCLAGGALVMFAFAAAAESPPESAAPSAPVSSADETADPTELAPPPADVLSTELMGLDSLGLISDTLVTQFQGGTRRVHLERTVFRRQTPVMYTSHGVRDPFRALVIDERKEGEIETDLLRLENAVLTGVIWSDGEYLAMLRDKEGNSFLLREGDPVFNGRLTALTQSQAVFDIVEFGDYQQAVLKVASSDKFKDKVKS